MSDRQVPRARSITVTEDLRQLDNLADPDFVYGCAVTPRSDDSRTAEQWAGSVFEDMPGALRVFIVFGWRAILRLRLAPRSSPAHMLGWSVLSTSPTTVLGAKSPFLSAHLVVRVERSRVVHLTFVRYERFAARVLWPLAAPIHRLTMPFLLNRVAREGR